MRKTLWTIAFFILTAALFLFADKKPQAKEARIEFAETKFDFGEVGQDKVLEHIFKFRNTGTDTLRIHRVKSS